MQEQHTGRAAGRVTAAVDRVPWSERAGLMLGALASTGTWGTLGVLKDPFFTVILGVNPAVLSTIFFVQRLWDACIDPLIGQYSDNFRSRWGRRKPLLLVGAPLMTLGFAALWWFPAGASSTIIAIALAISSLLFAACFTLYSMPLAGLTMEATGDYHERTRIAGLVGVAAFAFAIAIQWIFPLAQSGLFPDTVSGIRWVTGACAVMFLGCALAPVFLCRERTYAQAAAKPPMPLLPSLRTALACAPLRTLLAMRLVFTLCYSVVQQFAFFMNLYYVFGGKVAPALWAFAWISTSFHVMAIAGSTLLYPALSRRLGKRATIQCAAAILVVGCICKIFLYAPGEPWWQLIFLASNGLAISGLSLITSSMLGDIADDDELRHGVRREALFAALNAWVDKAGAACGGLLTGYLLVLYGFDAKQGAQSTHTLELMKWSYVVLPMVGAFAAMLMIRRYPITEAMAYATRDELVRRHAARDQAASP